MQKNNHEKITKALNALGIKKNNGGTSVGAAFYGNGKTSIPSFSPVDNKEIAAVVLTQKTEYNDAVKTALKAFEVWRLVPAPKEGKSYDKLVKNYEKKKKIWLYWFRMKWENLIRRV